MISVEDSIPTVSDTYLQGQDIFFYQFNDVNFYVEDLDQENFYLLILQKLFVDVTISKIFPLNGKRNVIEAARVSCGDKKQIFIVDKDFDDLLNKKESIPNLFYLEKYSIENYLVDLDSLKEYIVEEKPAIDRSNIESVFDWNKFTNECVSLFHELSGVHLLVQKRCSHIPNVATKPESFCIFNPPSIMTKQLDTYKNKVEAEIARKDKRLKFSVQLSKSMKQIGSDIETILSNIPGKYLMKFLKNKVENKFDLSKRDVSSFNYRMAKNNPLYSLNFLKTSISNFLR